MGEMRLQKILAAAGVASRRQAEKMIEAGRVKVDGKLVSIQGLKVDPAKAKIELDGRTIKISKKSHYLMMNKPKGVVSTVRDERGRKTVMELLGKLGSISGSKRVFHVGRLDYNTEGLLLFTNDGDLALVLTHPSNQVPKSYRARVRGHVTPELLTRLTHGLNLDDGFAQALDARLLKKNERSCWIEISVTEGRNRLVRRMLQALGHPVQRLIRVDYGGVELGGLPSGAVRELTNEEVNILKRWKEKKIRKRKRSGRGGKV